MTVKLPQSIELRSEDPESIVRSRIMSWARDVVRFLRALPSVSFATVDIPASPDLFVLTDGRPRSVSVARVVSGTVTGTPGIGWSNEGRGIRITALYGFSGSARLALRIEV